MAHFAELNEQNVVQRVIVVPDDVEHDGAAWCAKLLGGRWVQTSYNGRMRRRFAGKGMTFDAQRDAFIEPQPFASWLLNEQTLEWEAPVAHPDDDRPYRWDESSQQWVSIEGDD